MKFFLLTIFACLAFLGLAGQHDYGMQKQIELDKHYYELAIQDMRCNPDISMCMKKSEVKIYE